MMRSGCLHRNSLFALIYILFALCQLTSSKMIDVDGLTKPCDFVCGHGACIYERCEFSHCPGGGCTFIDSKDSTCAGGACTFENSIRSTCNGGR